jgi:hypothetical protein
MLRPSSPTVPESVVGVSAPSPRGSSIEITFAEAAAA